ncbi:MAG TPA: glyoxalase/bleomycin resistance/extradiol dioxygenase family protein [Povalibacter sp.]|jgi:PhnB protein
MSAVPDESTGRAQPPMPKVLGGVVAYLTVGGASAASEFYQRAFGATEVFRYPVDEQGRTMHIHLYVNGSSVMLNDPYPEHGHPLKTPQGFNMTLQVDDIDQWWDRAVAAGAKVEMPVSLMFWGSRYGQVRDPFGVMWSMNEKPRQSSHTGS